MDLPDDTVSPLPTSVQLTPMLSLVVVSPGLVSTNRKIFPATGVYAGLKLVGCTNVVQLPPLSVLYSKRPRVSIQLKPETGTSY